MLLTGNHKGDLCFKIAIVIAIFSIIFDLGQYLWRYCYLWRKIGTYKKRQKKEVGSTEIATPVFSQLGAIEILYFGKLVLTAISAVVFFLGCIPFIFYS